MASKRKAHRQDLQALLFQSKSPLSAEHAPHSAADTHPPATPPHKSSPRPSLAAHPQNTLLFSLLEQHLQEYAFSEQDKEGLPLLEHQLRTSPLLNNPQVAWLVLHKQGAAFASVTSTEELKRVARAGDTALSLALLRFLAEHPLPHDLVQTWRASAPDLFRTCSDLILLQVLTLPVLKRSLKQGVPSVLLPQLETLVEDAYAKTAKPLALALRQARALELLRDTWARTGDSLQTLAEAPALCARMAR